MLLIWYPKCSTCIKAKKYLDSNSVNYDLRDIVLDTPSKDEIRSYLDKSGKDIRKFFNTSGMKYRELGLKDKIKDLSIEELLDLLESDGMLIKRPLLILEDDVLIGFREKEWSEKIENN